MLVVFFPFFEKKKSRIETTCNDKGSGTRSNGKQNYFTRSTMFVPILFYDEDRDGTDSLSNKAVTIPLVLC